MSIGRLYDQQGVSSLCGPSVPRWPVHSQVLQRCRRAVDLAMKAFFRRVKAGETPGFRAFGPGVV